MVRKDEFILLLKVQLKFLRDCLQLGFESGAPINASYSAHHSIKQTQNFREYADSLLL